MSEHPEVDPLDRFGYQDYAFWHRLASETVVMVSDRKFPERDDELLDTALQLAAKAKAVSTNPVQDELNAKFVAAVEGMRERLHQLHG